MDVSEIVDNTSFERWLKETNQPREVCFGLARSAALRVLPHAWDWFTKYRKDDLTALPILRLHLSLLVSIGNVSQEVITAARAAANAARAAANAANYTTGTASSAASAACNATYSANAAGSAAYAVYAASLAAADVYAALRQDCQNIQNGTDWLTQPLWFEMPIEIVQMWFELAKSLRAEAARTNEATARSTSDALDWTFFVEWYENALHGKPQNQKLIEDIVLSLEIDWEAPSQALDVINQMWREAKGARSPVASAALTDFTFAANYNQMVAVGFDLDRDHWRDPKVVAGFLEDIEDLKDLIQNFSDFARDHLTGGNAEVDVVTQNDALLKELDFCNEKQRIRPGNILSLAMVLEDASNDADTNAALGEGLANMLDRNLEQIRKISATQFTKDMQRLEPLDDMSLDTLSADQVVDRLGDAFTALVKAGQDDLIPLREQDATALRQMIEALKDVEASIGATPDEKFRERQKRKIAQRAGALGNTIGYLYERTIEAAKKSGAASDKVIAQFKRVKGLTEIYQVLADMIRSFGGS